MNTKSADKVNIAERASEVDYIHPYFRKYMMRKPPRAKRGRCYSHFEACVVLFNEPGAPADVDIDRLAAEWNWKPEAVADFIVELVADGVFALKHPVWGARA